MLPLRNRAGLAFAEPASYIERMNGPTRSRSEALRVLRAHEAELRAHGVETLTLFGSMARNDATAASDVDLAVRLGAEFSAGGFDHFGRLEALRARLFDVLGCEVALVDENAARPRLRQVIEREGVRAF
jgi:predicted nucleotidyltransferase